MREASLNENRPPQKSSAGRREDEIGKVYSSDSDFIYHNLKEVAKRLNVLQEYLAHKKTPPPRTQQQPYA